MPSPEPLTPPQQDTLAAVYPLVRWTASRYGKAPGIYDDALDGAIHAIRTHDASRGKLAAWVRRNAGMYVTRRHKRLLRVERLGSRDIPVSDDGLREVDLRDEVSRHLRLATPWQRRAMLSILRGESPYANRRHAMTEYRKGLTRRTLRRPTPPATQPQESA